MALNRMSCSFIVLSCAANMPLFQNTKGVDLQHYPLSLRIFLEVKGLQVRAGTGGGEAALWAADLLRMYTRYAATQNWKVNTLNLNEGEGGGFKEAVIQVSNWQRHHLKYLHFLSISCTLSSQTVLENLRMKASYAVFAIFQIRILQETF